MRVNSIDFFEDIFEKKGGIPHLYTVIFYADTHKPLYVAPFAQGHGKAGTSPIYSIKFFPDYLGVELRTNDRYIIKRVVHVKGYSINLEGIDSVDTYLKTQFESKARNNIKRYGNRLETCFNIRYNLFYGEISILDYNYIMDALEHMLVKRFEQRKDTNAGRYKWKKTKETAFELIREKRASLFVIYDGTKPIQVSLNYHFHGILFYAVSSYDIDYSKFGMGHITIYKLIEWCISNNYTIFEMGRGDLDYKRRWSNRIYNLERHLIGRKSSLIDRCYILSISASLQFKYFLKSKNVHLYMKKAMEPLRKGEQMAEEKLQFKIDPIDPTINVSDLTHIDNNDISFSFLRKTVYDFLYTNQECMSNILIYKATDENTYLVIGKNHGIKITLAI